MSEHTALNSSTSLSNRTEDDDDLKTLKLQDIDLEHFAAYFELAFDGDFQSITVLVALLQRLRGVERLRHEKQTGVWIEDVVCRLTRRLYMNCEPGLEAANRFGFEATNLAEHIFSERFTSHPAVHSGVGGRA